MATAAQAFATTQEELAYYKSGFEQLEADLQDFQQSSRELEAELEKDVEASEKRERDLRDKVDAVTFQLEEWRNKYNQSRLESSAAQNTLQKEITSLREANRSVQLKLRDMEVANDEYEVQARNTTSSLDDLESKYNQVYERNILLEEEIKSGESERETLRIETQRLRDELSDLNVEHEITLEKLRAAQITNEGRPRRVSQLSESNKKRLSSAHSDRSVITDGTATTRSHVTATSGLSTSEPRTPSSLPYSSSSGRPRLTEASKILIDLTVPPHNDTPRPEHAMQKKLRSRPSGTIARRVRPSANGHEAESLARTNSLYHMRGLMGEMRRLEERLQTAKARLPLSQSHERSLSPSHPEDMPGLPTTVTMRSPTKRPSVLPASTTRSPRANEPRRSSDLHSPRPPVPPKDSMPLRHSVLQHDRVHEEYVDPVNAPSPSRPHSRMSAAFRRPESAIGVRAEKLHSHNQSQTHVPHTATLPRAIGSRPSMSSIATPIAVPRATARGRPSVGASLIASKSTPKPPVASKPPGRPSMSGRPSISSNNSGGSKTTVAGGTPRRRSNLATPSMLPPGWRGTEANV